MLKRVLQVVLALWALIALATGVMGVVVGSGASNYHVTDRLASLALDSNLRYFSGVWIGVGIGLLWMLPSIERHVALLRLIALTIFLGGVGRGISMIALGVPGMPFPMFTAFEIAFPLVLLLQSRIEVEHA